LAWPRKSRHSGEWRLDEDSLLPGLGSGCLWRLEIEPIRNQKRSVADRHALFTRNEVEDVSARLALSEALEATLGSRDPETGLVAAAVDGAGADKTITRPLETVGYPVVVEDLNDRH
jgi:hypothetical protein